MNDLCHGCKQIREIDYTNPAGQTFCIDCQMLQPLTSDEWARILLVAPWSKFGPPFRLGDKVEARTGAQIYDGVGEVTNVSMSLEHGGTPVYPTFRVVINKKAHDLAPDEAWYTEVCLTKVE